MASTLARTARAATLGACLLAGTSAALALNLPFGFGGGARDRATVARTEAEPPVQMAQLGDASQRISQLEEENRRLNGKLEELSFQVLQMQEQMRKMQEDTDFRFQELEGKGAARPAGGTERRGEATPPAADPAPGASTAASAAGRPSGDEIGSLLQGDPGTAPAATGSTGAPATRPAATPAAPSGTIASIQTKNAGELYGLAYNYLLAGDYQLAENSFRQYTQTYPDAKDVPDARYWLGESMYQQRKYADAAEVFLNAQKDYPKSPKAPEMMLKLGMSLAKLDNRDTACVTFKEVARRYPQMGATVKRKLQTESQAAKCSA